MVLFKKIYYDVSVIKFPTFIVKQINDSARTHFQRQTRAFNDNDILKLKSTLAPKVDAFKKSYFYRSLNFWNTLPKEIRSIESSSLFKINVIDNLWSIAEGKVQ